MNINYLEGKGEEKRGGRKGEIQKRVYFCRSKFHCRLLGLTKKKTPGSICNRGSWFIFFAFLSLGQLAISHLLRDQKQPRHPQSSFQILRKYLMDGQTK